MPPSLDPRPFRELFDPRIPFDRNFLDDSLPAQAVDFLRNLGKDHPALTEPTPSKPGASHRRRKELG